MEFQLIIVSIFGVSFISFMAAMVYITVKADAKAKQKLKSKLQKETEDTYRRPLIRV
jgi:hypothetical protein